MFFFLWLQYQSSSNGKGSIRFRNPDLAEIDRQCDLVRANGQTVCHGQILQHLVYEKIPIVGSCALETAAAVPNILFCKSLTRNPGWLVTRGILGLFYLFLLLFVCSMELTFLDGWIDGLFILFSSSSSFPLISQIDSVFLFFGNTHIAKERRKSRGEVVAEERFQTVKNIALSKAGVNCSRIQTSFCVARFFCSSKKFESSPSFSRE